jgi:hypothetical protein
MGAQQIHLQNVAEQNPAAMNLPAARATIGFAIARSLDSFTDFARCGRGRTSPKFFRLSSRKGTARVPKRKNYNSMTRLMRQGSALSSFFLTRKRA